MREEELVKTLEQLGKEATWCRTCLKRDKCDIKETVAMEQKLVVPYPVKYVDVKIKCRNIYKIANYQISQMFLHQYFLYKNGEVNSEK